MFMLNIIFYKNVFSIESDLNDKEAFSLIIAFLTLVCTVLISIVQFMAQSRKEQEKKNKNVIEKNRKKKKTAIKKNRKSRNSTKEWKK